MKYPAAVPSRIYRFMKALPIYALRRLRQAPHLNMNNSCHCLVGEAFDLGAQPGWTRNAILDREYAGIPVHEIFHQDSVEWQEEEGDSEPVGATIRLVANEILRERGRE